MRCWQTTFPGRRTCCSPRPTRSASRCTQCNWWWGCWPTATPWSISCESASSFTTRTGWSSFSSTSHAPTFVWVKTQSVACQIFLGESLIFLVLNSAHIYWRCPFVFLVCIRHLCVNKIILPTIFVGFVQLNCFTRYPSGCCNAVRELQPVKWNTEL